MKYLFLILLLFGFVATGANNSLQIDFNRISPDGGIAYSAISSIQTDKNGFVWFSCMNGVYVYNGYEYSHYRHNESDTTSIPSNFIFDIEKDSDNRMWFCTDNGLCFFNYAENNFIRVNISGIEDNKIYSMHEISLNSYLLLTGKGLYLFDTINYQVKYIDNQPDLISVVELYDEAYVLIGTSDGYLYELNLETASFTQIFHGMNDSITSLCIDGDKFYIGYKNSGILSLNRRGHIICHYTVKSLDPKYRISNDNIRIVTKRRNNEIWIGTYDGLMVLYYDSLSVITKSNSSLLTNSIYDIHVDDSDNIWLGTWSGGLYYYNIYNYNFKSFYSLQNKSQIGVVSSFANNDKSSIWIGSENEGLILYDYNKKSVLKHVYTDSIHIKSLLKYKSKLFIGTVDHGLYSMDLFPDRTESTIQPIKLANNKDIISYMAINDDVLWISQGNNSIVKYNIFTGEEKRFVILDEKEKQDNRIFQIFIHTDGSVIVCTNKGLFVKANDSEHFSLMNKECLFLYSIVSINSNEYILGSREKGLYVYNIHTGDMSKYEIEGKLDYIDIYTLQIDLQRRLWLSTNKGIYYLDLQTKRLESFVNSDGLNVKQFHPLSALSNSDGIIFWGNTMGVNYLDTHDIRINTVVPDTYIVGIMINNKEPDFAGNMTDVRYLPDIKHLDLCYNYNTLSFRFVSNNLLKPEKNRIRYKLDGYQNEWVEIVQGENAIFTQVPPGKYKLMFKASNNDLVWGNEKSVFIHIKAPFYATVYAYVFYIIVFFVIIYRFYSNKIVKVGLKKEIELEKYKINIISQLSDERTKFFINLSHELRTPLTLIDLPLKALEKISMNKEQDFHISTIRRNTNRLIRLTDQIIDYRLLEIDKLTIHRQKIDIVELFSNIINDLDYLIKSKGVKLSFHSDASKRYIVVDEKMIEKVIYNLLLNSFKYSHEPIIVEVEIKKVELSDNDYNNYFYVGEKVIGKSLKISFKDNGIGIVDSNFSKIFERFSTTSSNSNEGTGIGLHLCKEYIAKHSGCIMLDSVEGQGSEFTVCLPLNLDTEEEETLSYDILPRTDSTENVLATYHDVDDKIAKKKRILIIENNDEMLCYLKQTLSDLYKCLFAKNITTGTELALELLPDLIVIDNNMPYLSGLKCIEGIKENKAIADIPIILISSDLDPDIQCKCISAGANVFLPKPINEEVFLQYVKTLMKSRNIVDPMSGLTEKSSSKDFMVKLNEIIETNLNEISLDLDFVAKRLNVSRSTLFRRVKSETGNNISEYIRNLKLEKATTLIKSGENSIEDIASMCGFNSTSYFCKCFKDKYGVTPKEFSRGVDL